MEIPIELFLGAIGLSLALVVVGFIRQPQIPVTVVLGGMFILFLAVTTTEINMGKIPITSVTSGSTVTYTFIDNLFSFTEIPKVIFGLIGSIMMLIGGLMVNKAE